MLLEGKALVMINGLNGRDAETGFCLFLGEREGETVGKTRGQGDKGAGCKPQRNGDLW